MLTAAAGLAAALVLFLCPPTQYAFYPHCFFHAWTGLYCPGCGSLRALHALAHGHLGAAFGFNPLLIVALPFLAYEGASRWRRNVHGTGLPALFVHPSWSWALLGVVLVFTVLRNIPAAPFTLLAP